MRWHTESKCVPAHKFAVAGSGTMLVVGGLSVVACAFPLVGSALLVAFFVGTTPKMHDFWNAGEDERQNEMNHFLKNTALLGGSLAFVALSTQGWAYDLVCGYWANRLEDLSSHPKIRGTPVHCSQSSNL